MLKKNWKTIAVVVLVLVVFLYIKRLKGSVAPVNVDNNIVTPAAKTMLQAEII